MKQAEEAMEILEAFDLVGTLRGAAQLANCLSLANVQQILPRSLRRLRAALEETASR